MKLFKINPLNNVWITEYLDATGTVVAQYRYDAFGAVIAEYGAMSSSFAFKFSTKYHDPETDLYYYGYRFYSPELRRWINRDPIEEEGGINLYAFCNNNPVIFIDLYGNVPSAETFWSNYDKYSYANMTASNVWEAIGGSVKDTVYDNWSPGMEHPNACAARVSVALIGAGEIIPNNMRDYINTVKRGQTGVSGNYIVNAAQMGKYLRSEWGITATTDASKAYYFKPAVSAGDFKTLKTEIESVAKLKCNQTKYVAVVVSLSPQGSRVSGHVGVVTNDYKDDFTPYTASTEVWILPRK